MRLSQVLDESKSDHEVKAWLDDFIEEWFTQTDETKLEPLPEVIYLGEGLNG